MKKLFIASIILILIFIPLSLASTSKQTFKVGNTTSVNGKMITLKYIEDGKILIDVDGFSSRIQLTASFYNDTVVYTPNFSISGVLFNVTDVISSLGELRAEVTINFVCGNKICEASEAGFCCKDCNCSSGYSCIDNQCIETTLNKCLNDSNCNDNNNCTVDLCVGIPRECSHTSKPCKDYDFCCPAGCTFDNDADCPNQTIKNITSNVSSITKNCSLGTQQTVENISSYCSETGWKAKKPDNSACVKDYECLNGCIGGKCGQKEKIIVPKTTYILIGTIILVLIAFSIVFSRIVRKNYSAKSKSP